MLQKADDRCESASRRMTQRQDFPALPIRPFSMGREPKTECLEEPLKSWIAGCTVPIDRFQSLMREKYRTCPWVHAPESLLGSPFSWNRITATGPGNSRSALIYCTRTRCALENVRIAIAISCVGNVVENLLLIRSRSHIVFERRGTVYLRAASPDWGGNPSESCFKVS